MIESKKNVPQIYRTSRDFKALMKLLDIITCVNKSDCDNIVSLINPDRCPDKYLPLLASYVGYDYDYNLSYDTNRNIIKYYPNLVRLRGSEDGLKLAAAIAISSADARYSIQSSYNLVSINYNKSSGSIFVYLYFNNYLSKINDLLDVVKPIGLNCSVVSSETIRNSEQIDISDKFIVSKFDYSKVSYRYKITDENNNTTIALDVPLNTGETIVPGTFNINIPVYFKCKYKYSDRSGNEPKEVEVIDNILKSIRVIDKENSALDNIAPLECSGSDSLELTFSSNIGVTPLADAFKSNLLNTSVANNINYTTGRLNISIVNPEYIDSEPYNPDDLNISDTEEFGNSENDNPPYDIEILKVYYITDATVTYETLKDGIIKQRNSKIRDEVGFGQVDDYTRFDSDGEVIN